MWSSNLDTGGAVSILNRLVRGFLGFFFSFSKFHSMKALHVSTTPLSFLVISFLIQLFLLYLYTIHDWKKK